ncbi:SAV0927 family protein [Aquibacillus kalidii]|uniref:SAV0927 family protein n=1 Tax=Aquibacillus kalidii TaxID=2762597 RepID=UPI001F2D2F8F|nr:SAV0927 family protein [Aquibacillus kalidii]
MSDPTFIKDELKNAQIRYVTFKGSYHRYDIAVISTDGDTEKLIMDLNGNRFSFMNKEKLMQENFVEHNFNINEIEADEFRSFLTKLL